MWVTLLLPLALTQVQFQEFGKVRRKERSLL